MDLHDNITRSRALPNTAGTVLVSKSDLHLSRNFYYEDTTIDRTIHITSSQTHQFK